MYTWKTHIHRNQPTDSRYIWQYLLNEVCAIKICPSAEFLLRNAILLVFIIMHKSIQAFVYFCQLLHVSIRTTYFV